MKEISCKPLTTYDLKSIMSNYPKEVYPLLMTIPAIARRLNVLELYVNSHDNLIRRIYEKELTLLPVRLGTLDFSAIQEKIIGEDIYL